MRKLLAIGVSLFLLCGLGGKSEKLTLFPTQVLPQRYTHLIETSQSQTSFTSKIHTPHRN